MKKILLSLLLAVCIVFSASAYRYNYETVPGDPLNALIYTLPNGLKVFMTVNKDVPRIQTYIPVRVGGKNDPAETTGLAHYFEHLMFKGTEQFGTKDYAREKPMLDSIESLFETYRHTTDEQARKDIYHIIDSISYQASLIAIPNEYDKLMAAIGADGTNAYTSTDVTCYVEDIPSNQIENWAMIQADRFMHPVLRGFHTELETIYEEKNMSLTNDSRKAFEALLSIAFPSHPYGTQTVLGTQEHLKNPSITNVKKYHETWYVPNNMAICLSGDFDPDNMIDIITRYFGQMKPNPNLPVLNFPEEKPLTAPVSKDVFGKEAETVYLAWRIPAAAHEDMAALNVLSEVMQNGKCGIIDVNVSQPQKVLAMSSFPYSMADKGIGIIAGRPKPGQTLEEVRDIAIDQVKELRAGNFDNDLVSSAINNLKLILQESIEKNADRADYFVNAFVNGESWANAVDDMKKIESITKDDVIAVANKYFNPGAYIAVYKRQGDDPNELKIAKPQITPIATNRDDASDFLTSVLKSKVEPIEPSFVDFEKSLTKAAVKKNQVQVLYTHNNTNDLAQLTLIYEYGKSADKALAYASQYLGLLGTKKMSVAQIKNEFYKLACSYFISVGQDRTFVVINGLSENLPKALKLYETLVADAVDDPQVWEKLVDRNIKAMNDAKTNQRSNFSRLRQYALYGSQENNPSLVLDYTPEQLKALNPRAVLKSLRDMSKYAHRIIYYGPEKLDKVLAMLEKDHVTAKKLVSAPAGRKFPYALTDETVIYVAPYDAKQLYMSQVSNQGELYNPSIEPLRNIYNEYFGGGMNSIVFQEMRESRSLAYSAWAGMSAPSKADRPYLFRTSIATQNDKLGDAIDAFNLIINDMPQSESAFKLAKEGLESRLRTDRTIKDDIAWAWIAAQDLGVDHDTNADVFKALPTTSLADIIAFQQNNVKGRKYSYAILGKIEDLDIDALRKLGRVVILSTEDIFGY